MKADARGDNEYYGTGDKALRLLTQTPEYIVMEKRKHTNQESNQGEGNRTAAREYNQAQRRFVRSGKVDRKAREAERDLDDSKIRRELEHAEAIGRRHAAKEDPEVKRRY